MREAVRTQMAREAVRWRDLGIIDTGQGEQLARRYDRSGHTLAVLLKWLGVFAIVQLAFAVGTFIALSTDSAWLGTAMLTAAAAAAWHHGTELATDPLARQPVTGAVLVTASLAAGLGALALAVVASGGELDEGTGAALLAIGAVASIVTAYRHHLRWPLLLGLLFAFQSLGAWHAYLGGGRYGAVVPDPELIAPVALAVAALGLWHERVAERGPARRAEGFGHLFLVLGLVYLDVSLWFTTIPHGSATTVALFTLACIVQIVAGARLGDGRLTGFGVVFLGVDLYTRYFEFCRDRLPLAAILVIGGAAALAAGYAFERLALERRDGGAR